MPRPAVSKQGRTGKSKGGGWNRGGTSWNKGSYLRFVKARVIVKAQVGEPQGVATVLHHGRAPRQHPRQAKRDVPRRRLDLLPRLARVQGTGTWQDASLCRGEGNRAEAQADEPEGVEGLAQIGPAAQ